VLPVTKAVLGKFSQKAIAVIRVFSGEMQKELGAAPARRLDRR
jgi:hypothetical protein